MNEEDQAHEELVLEISCEPTFFEAKKISIKSLPAHSTEQVGVITVNLREDFLLRLPEQCEAIIRLTLKKVERCW